MGHLRVQRDYLAAPGEAEALWHDPDRWPAWVDGFGHVVSIDEAWPAPGATAVWDSRPGGRGRVHEPGIGHSVEVHDERLRATQSVSFEALDGGVGTILELDYALAAAGPLTALSDLLFIRRALRDSLARTLARFGHELLVETPPAGAPREG